MTHDSSLPPDPATSSLASLEPALAVAHAWVDEIGDALKSRSGGAEPPQAVTYDLARTVAELEAARALDETTPETAGLPAALAAAYTARALWAARGRLEPRLLELEISRAPAWDDTGWLDLLASDREEQLGADLLAASARFDEDLLAGPHRLLRETYRRFAEEVVRPVAEDIHRRDLLVSEDILQGLGDLGCFGLSIPQRYGGLLDEEEPDTLSMLLATEELSAASLGAAGSLITRPEVVARAVLAGGTEDQKQRWLPAMASGEKLCAVAVTEPDYGSDVASMQLRATPSPGGFRLRGAKLWSTFAGRAELLMVLARTAPGSRDHRGLSLFVIEKPPFEGQDFEVRQPGGGSLRGRAIPTIGYRGMHSYECFFDDWEVAPDGLVGGEAGLGRGFYMTMAGFAGGRIQTAARAVGVMQAAYGEAHDYARRRHAFGRPIGDFGLTRSKIVAMAARLHASRRFTYQAARRVDQGAGDTAAAMVKLFASRAAEEVTREAVQLHGGMGYAEESAVSRYFVDARVLSIFEGTEEILALKVVARSLLGR